jgi:hypothetical protein
MKRQLLVLTLALAALLPVSSRAEGEVSFQFFYDNLTPYGEWVDVGDYGTCWRPNDIDDDWSPYTDGYWSYTDAGWTWVSYEDFGDICYHYGRWVRAEDVGWCWVPDYEWGPAWVSWRSDDDYIGWAPLPPEAHWRSSVGFSVYVDDYYDIGPSYYNFCPVVEFCAPVIRHVCVPRVSVWGIFGHTSNITNICFNSYHNVPFCGGPNFTYISGRVRRPIPTLKLVQNTTIINNNYTIINNRRVLKAPRNTVAGNTLNVFAPKVIKNADTLIKPQVTKVVAKDKVKRGWELAKDPGEAKQLRDKVKIQSKGLNPETAPAKPVQIADLKPLPEKADPQAPSPVARPNRLMKDRDNDGVPDRKEREIAGQPDRPGKDKPGRPGAGPGLQQPGVDRPGPGVAEAQPRKGGKGGKGDKADGQPEAPVVGVNPERPEAPDRPDKPGKGGIRKPFKEGRPENPVANDQPVVRPNPVDAPEREQGGGKGKAKKAQADAAEEIERQQQRQRAAALEAQRDQAERQQRQLNAARMEQQQQNAERLERQRQNQAAEQQERAQRQQQAAGEARRQQAVEAQRQQQAELQERQQQRAIEAQRQQQMQRQFEAQQQRQQQLRQQQQQPRPERPPQQVQQVPQRQIQNPNPGVGNGDGGDGRARGKGDRELTPEEAQALRRKQRGF